MTISRINKHFMISGMHLLIVSLSLILVLFFLTDFQRADSSKRITLHDNLINGSDKASDSPVARTLHQASLNPETCVTYDVATRLITITCVSARLSDVGKALNDSSILKNEGNGTWLLNSNLSIADGADFTIDSNDTKWLKINSTTSKNAYHIQVTGNLKIDLVKITSWNSTTNNYAETDGIIHRASITIPKNAVGTAYISNSELAYLGYDASPYQGLSYYGGDGAIIRNNTIHNLWYGFYSNGRANMIIEDNHVYDNVKYGLDPHTGTRDMMISNNRVHDNAGLGIVCSLDCNNITIVGNEIYRNKIGALLLSRNVMNSLVSNNSVYDEIKGLVLSESHNNEIHNNNVSNTDVAIEIKAGSSENKISENSIASAIVYAINIVKDAKQNTISHNNVFNSHEYGICVHNNGNNNTITENYVSKSAVTGICVANQSSGNLVKSNFINGSLRNGIRVSDSDSNNNTVSYNEINDATIGLLVDNNTNSLIMQNTVGDSKDSDYSVSKNGFLKLQETNFSSDKISAIGKNESSVQISDSGIILVEKDPGNNQTTVNTNQSAYTARLIDPESLVITTVR